LTRSLHIRTATCCRRTRISKVSSTRERSRTRIPAEGQNKSDRRPRFSTRHRTQPGGDRPTQTVEIGQLHSIGHEQYPIRRNRGAALHGATLVMHRRAFSGTPARRLYPGLSRAIQQFGNSIGGSQGTLTTDVLAQFASKSDTIKADAPHLLGAGPTLGGI
jgi:hypothetical protein